MPKYQGSEFQSIIQAPTKSALDDLIGSAKEFAESNKMDDFKVLESGPDPDGGYRAIVTAHNWNPISWIKGKLTRKKEFEEEIPEEEDPKKVKEKAKEEYEEFLAKSKRKEEVAKIQREYDLRRAERIRAEEDVLKEKTEEEAIQQMVRKLPIKDREAAARRIREGIRSGEQADIEVQYEGIPEKIITKQKVLQREYWTDKETGKPIPEPRTAEERAKADYHPSQWTFIDVPRDLSRAERSGLARAIQFEKMELDIAREKYKDFKFERSKRGKAVKAIKGIGGFGQFMAGAVTLGAAGVARGMQPGRGGPARATRMHAPGVPLELYRVRPMLGVGMPSSRDLTGSGLGHLREAILPRIRRTKREVRQVRRDIE